MSNGSLASADNAERVKRRKERKLAKRIARSKHILSWALGMSLSFIPLMLGWIGLHTRKNQQEVLKIYEDYIVNFYSSGSFLWLGVTVLGMSLVELLLCGYRKPSWNVWRIMAVVLGVVVMFGAGFMYANNILQPYNIDTMICWSWCLVLGCAIIGAIISFGLTKEI